MRDGERKLTRLAYTVHISHRDPQSFVGLSRKKMRLAKRQRMRLLKIESIKPSRQTRAQCITVSHHAGLYITDDHIVTHNSFMSLWIAGTLASRGLPVLYCDWEFSAGEQRKRFRRLFGEMPAALHYVRCDRPLTRDADRLSRMVQDLAIQYAVADSIGFAADGPAETHEVAMRYFDGIRRLRVGSLSLSHIAKYVEEGQQPTAFGSAYFRAGARSMWFIQQSSSNPPDEIRVGLYHHKSNTGPRLPARAYVLTFSRSSITVAPTDIYAVPDLAGMLPLPERLLRLLRDDGERTVKRAAEELNVTQKAIYAVVAKHRREFWKSGDTIAVAETERQPESSPATPPPSDKDGHIDF